jgi:DNA-binding NtrC family response regulator
VAHLAGPRRGRPFLVVDAADPSEQTEANWRAPGTSPLALAEGGTLVVLNAAALPEPTQAFVADALGPGRDPWGDASQVDVVLVVSLPAPVDARLAAGRAHAPVVHAPLAERLGDKAIALPPLAARTEDLRALFIDRLGRIGVRLRGRPMGLDPRALARLVEHGWPGNEVELEDVLSRAASVAEGEVITAAHLEQVGFSPVPQPPRRGPRPSSRPPGPWKSPA